MIEVTEVRFYGRRDVNLLTFATIVLGEAFVVRDIRIVERRDGSLLVCMPSRKTAMGTYEDVAHPIRSEFRKSLEDKILGAWRERCSQAASADGPR